MAGYVVVRDGYVRTYAGVWFAVSGARPVLTDENGTLCCCGQGGCCDACTYTIDPGLRCSSKRCCFTRGDNGDLIENGYWFIQEVVGSNFWTIEATQTGTATQINGSATVLGWQFTATVRERCRVNGVITDTTYSDTLTISAGFLAQVVDNGQCRQLHVPALSAELGCYSQKHSRFLAQPLQWIGGGNFRDPCSENFDCYNDTRSCTADNRGFDGAVWTFQLMYTVNKCHERCTSNCTTCP